MRITQRHPYRGLPPLNVAKFPSCPSGSTKRRPTTPVLPRSPLARALDSVLAGRLPIGAPGANAVATGSVADSIVTLVAVRLAGGHDAGVGCEVVIAPWLVGYPMLELAARGVVPVVADVGPDGWLTAASVAAVLSPRTVAVVVDRASVRTAAEMGAMSAAAAQQGAMFVIDGWNGLEPLPLGAAAILHLDATTSCAAAVAVGDAGVALARAADDPSQMAIAASTMSIDDAVAAQALALVNSGRADDIDAVRRRAVQRLRGAIAASGAHDAVEVRPHADGALLVAVDADALVRCRTELARRNVSVGYVQVALADDLLASELARPTRWPFTTASDGAVGDQRHVPQQAPMIAERSCVVRLDGAANAEAAADVVADALRWAWREAPTELRDVERAGLLDPAASITVALPLPAPARLRRLVAVTGGEAGRVEVSAPWRDQPDVVRARSLVQSGGLGQVERMSIAVTADGTSGSADPLGVAGDRRLDDPLLQLGPAAIDLADFLLAEGLDVRAVLAARPEPSDAPSDTGSRRATIHLRGDGADSVVIDLTASEVPLPAAQAAGEPGDVVIAIYGTEGSVRIGTSRSSYRRDDRSAALEFGSGIVPGGIAATGRVPLERLVAIAERLDESAATTSWVRLD
jgi:hypothetical protein